MRTPIRKFGYSGRICQKVYGKNKTVGNRSEQFYVVKMLFSEPFLIIIWDDYYEQEQHPKKRTLIDNIPTADKIQVCIVGFVLKIL